MVQYRDLNAPPSRMLADVVADMKAQGRQSKTGDAGVKDLGVAGDVVWPRPDGTPVSVRDIDAELEGAKGRIDEASADLVVTQERLGAAEKTVAGVAGDLTRVETVVIPGAVADLEAADAANAQAVADARKDAADSQAALAEQIDADIEAARTSLEGDISAAQGAADAAQSAADQAASDAAAAAQQAADAAGVAASKGDVLIQSTAPVAAMRKATTLWIDTAGGANTPKRWNGTAWVVVTDKAATDAAAAAATAKSTADAAQAKADTAQATATDAATAAAAADKKAGNAQSTATQALTSANGKSKVTRSTSRPPTSYDGRVDDVWFTMSSMGSGGRVLFQEMWNGTTWVSATIDSQVIAYLDAAKITTGLLDVGTLIKAGAISVDKLAVGVAGNLLPDPLFLDSGLSLTRQNSGTRWAYKTVSGETCFESVMPAPAVQADFRLTDAAGRERYVPVAPNVRVVVEIDVSGPVTVYLPVRYADGQDATPGVTLQTNTDSGRRTARFEYDLSAVVAGNGSPVAQFSVAVRQTAGTAPPGTVTRVFSARISPMAGATVIENGAVTTDKVAANAITAGKIAAGAIEADKIAADAITVGKVSGLQGALDAKETPSGAQAKADAAKTAAQTAAAADAQSKANAAKAAAEAAAKTYSDTVAAGASQSAIDAAKADATAKANAAQVAAVAAAGIAAKAEYGETKTLVGGWRETGQTTIAGGAITTDSITSGHLKSGAVTTSKLTVTEDMSAAIVNAMSVNTKKLVVTEEAILNHATLIGQTVVDDINVQGKLIGKDGVFTGTVDFTNVNVTGTQIVNKLGANSISADKISGGSFEGNSFTGGQFFGSSFIGATYATSQYPGREGGVMIDPGGGLRTWNSSGKLTVQIRPDDGQIMLSDYLKAVNNAGRGVMLIPTTSTGGGGLWFSHTGGSSGSDAAIYRSGYDTNAREPIWLRGANGAGINVSGGVNVVSGEVSAGIGVFSTQVGATDFVHFNPPTTSAAANALIASSPAGRFYKSTSSRRYKKNIVDWNPDAERVLSLQPRQWQHDDPSQPEEIDETWHVGFVAEEVHDLGLERLVKYEGDGKGGWIPDGLNYDRFAAAQQVVLRKHETEITELRERIALLEAQIGTP